MRISKSKKAVTFDPPTIMAILVFVLIFLLIIVLVVTGGFSTFRKALGCKGLLTTSGMEQVPDCYKGTTCPKDTKPSENTMWSFVPFTGCIKGKEVCCVGSGPAPKTTGLIEVKINSAVAASGGSIEVSKGGNKASVKGSGDIKYCQINITIPMKDGKTTNKEIKDINTECTSAVEADFTVGEGADENIEGTYQLSVIGYDSAKTKITDSSANMKIKKDTSAGNAGTPTISFEMYDGLRNVMVTPDKEYKTDSAFVDMLVTYKGDWVISIKNPAGSEEKLTNSDCLGANCAKSDRKGVMYSFVSYGKYTFSLKYQEASESKSYGKTFIINSVPTLEGETP